MPYTRNYVEHTSTFMLRDKYLRVIRLLIEDFSIAFTELKIDPDGVLKPLQELEERVLCGEQFYRLTDIKIGNTVDAILRTYPILESKRSYGAQKRRGL